jgi:hypothetical protein
MTTPLAHLSDQMAYRCGRGRAHGDSATQDPGRREPWLTAIRQRRRADQMGDLGCMRSLCGIDITRTLRTHYIR